MPQRDSGEMFISAAHPHVFISCHLSSVACRPGQAALSCYFIYVYLRYFFTDDCWLVHQLKGLEEASVCWMVGLLLKPNGLQRAEPGARGGPGGRCFCCWSFTPEPDLAGERLCDCKRLKLCPCVYFSWLPHCIITCQHFRWGFICALKIAWGGRMQTLCSMLENVPPA